MSNHITIEEISELSRRSRRLLYGAERTPAVAADSAKGEDSLMTALALRTEASMVCSEEAKSESISKSLHSVKLTKPLKNALSLMRQQSENNMPFLCRHEAASFAQIKGGASLIEAEKEALRNNFIVKYALARAKTNICIWEITDQGYAWLGRARPMWSSKGKYPHKFCVHRIAHTFQRRGYDAKIEYRRPNGKLVDLRLSQADRVQYVEVCASWPIEKELTNILKDLEGEPLPDEIILAATERKMIKPLGQAIAVMATGVQLSRPVRLVLAGDLIDFLEVPK